MSDQQQCPVCAGRRKINRVSGRKMVREICLNCRGTGKVPGQEPLVVPDSVIEEAAESGSGALRGCEAKTKLSHGGRVEIDARSVADVVVPAAAPSIASWAREQGRTEGAAEERALARKVVGHRYGEAEAAYETSYGTYEQGRMDGIGELLTALDREDPA